MDKKKFKEENTREGTVIFPNALEFGKKAMQVNNVLADDGDSMPKRLAKMIRTVGELSKSNTRWDDTREYAMVNRGTIEDLTASIAVQAFTMVLDKISRNHENVLEMMDDALDFGDMYTKGISVSFATGDGDFSMDKWVCRIMEDLIGATNVDSNSTAVGWLFEMFTTLGLFAESTGIGSGRLWEIMYEFIDNIRNDAIYEPVASVMPF
jgi:hypothetical protein